MSVFMLLSTASIYINRKGKGLLSLLYPFSAQRNTSLAQEMLNCLLTKEVIPHIRLGFASFIRPEQGDLHWVLPTVP